MGLVFLLPHLTIFSRFSLGRADSYVIISVLFTAGIAGSDLIQLLRSITHVREMKPFRCSFFIIIIELYVDVPTGWLSCCSCTWSWHQAFESVFDRIGLNWFTRQIASNSSNKFAALFPDCALNHFPPFLNALLFIKGLSINHFFPLIYLLT